MLYFLPAYHNLTPNLKERVQILAGEPQLRNLVPGQPSTHMGDHLTPYTSQTRMSEEKGLLALPISMNLLRVDYAEAVDQG